MDGKEVYCVNYENGKPFVREVTREKGLVAYAIKTGKRRGRNVDFRHENRSD